MIPAPKVYAGQGAQTIRFIPVDKQGRPARVTSATYTIVDVDHSEDSSERTITSGAATLAAVDTTITAAAGASASDAKRLTVTSATGITVGRTYLLASVGGRYRNLVTVAGLASTTVYAHYPISGVYAASDTFQAIELEATFPLAEANDAEAIDDGRRYQIVWSYTLEGESFLTPQEVHLLRYSGEAWITEADVVRAYPPVVDRARNRFSITDAIVVASEDLAMELESSGQTPEQFRTSRVGLWAVRFRAIEYCLRWAGSDADLILADKYESRWTKAMLTLTGSSPGKAIKLSQGDDSAVTGGVDGLFKKP